ncbi:MAG: methyl-accepting chemotaxis protein [Pseudomonadota bacterium]
MLFQRLSIRLKLFTLPAVAAFGLLVVLGVAFSGAGRMARDAGFALDVQSEVLTTSQQLDVSLTRVDAIVRAAPAEFDSERLAELEAELTELLDQIGGLLMSQANDEAKAADMSEDVLAVQIVANKVFDFSKQFAQAQAVETIETEFADVIQAVQTDVSEARAAGIDRVAAIQTDIQKRRDRMTLVLISTGLTALVCSGGLSIITARKMSARISNMLHFAAALAKGSTAAFDKSDRARDELRSLYDALETLRLALVEKARLEEESAKAAQDRRESERLAMQLENDRQAAEQARERDQAKRDQAAQAEKLALQQKAEEEQAARNEEQMVVTSSLAQALHTLASGNLNTEINREFPETYEKIRLDFNATAGTLRVAMQDVKEVTAVIDGSVVEISQASNRLAERTESTAAGLEEAAASLTELTASIAASNRTAAEASQVVEDAMTRTERGLTAVEEMNAAMARIRDSSNEIAKITEMIDAIAFQTNLLALNAGVEAARAGESGRGFAVVASEVRALAQRATDAASEISQLITLSEGNVRNGTQLVEATGQSLSEISEAVSEIKGTIGSVQNACAEQASSVTEINSSITRIDRDTQSNAAMFEETTSATLVLGEQVQRLTHSVGQFDVSSGHEDTFTELDYAQNAETSAQVAAPVRMSA